MLVLGAAWVVACGVTAVPDATIAPATSSSTSEATLPVEPRFTTHGTKILAPDGSEFVPVGVNLLGPDSFWPFPTAGLSDDVLRWGFNTVRLNSCLPRGCEDVAHHDTNDDLDAIVDELTGAGIVAVIALHQVEPGRLPDHAETAEIATWWADIARRYAGNPRVWFNLLNEPGRGDPVPDRWRTIHDRLIEVVRDQGAHNLIVVDGTQWGQEAGLGTTGAVTERTSAILTHGRSLADAHDGLVFALHVYGQWAAGTEVDRVERLDRFVADVQALGLPLVIGETGAPAIDGAGDLADATRAAYVVARLRGVGVLAWHGQAGDGYELTQGGALDDAAFPDGAGRPAGLTWHGELLWSLARELRGAEDPP